MQNVRFSILAPVAIAAFSSTVLAAQEQEIAANAAELPLLDRAAKLHIENVPLNHALAELQRQSGVSLVYSPSRLPDGQIVSCHCRNATVLEALDRLLEGTHLRFTELDRHVLVEPDESVEPTVTRPTLRRGQFAMLRDVRSTVALPVVALRGLFSESLTGTITGRVTDASTGQPLVGATVRIEGTQRAMTVSSAGQYRFEDVAPGTYTIVATLIGYGAHSETVQVQTDAVSTVDLALSVSAVRLDEVVVTATGERRRVEVANVVGTVEAETLTRTAPITNLASLLNARVPGVQVLGSTGNVGSPSRIRIRGQNSMSLNNDPIVYVDGVRVSSSMGANGGGAGIFPSGWSSSRLDDLNPNEIESLDVLKGPAAVALYGTDAANGVIVIRTKRGAPGPARWTVFAEAGTIQQRANFPTAYHAWGRRTDNNAPMQCVLTMAAAGACAQDSISSLNLLKDPRSTPFGTGHRRQAGVQVSGGTAAARYFMAADYTDELGTLRMPADERERLELERGQPIPDDQLRPNRLKRTSVRGNFSATLASTAELGLSVGYSVGKHNVPTSDGSVVFGIMRNALEGRGYRDALGGWWQFRGGDIMALEQTDDIDRFTGGVDLDWRPLPWLATRARAGVDRTNRTIGLLQRRDQGPPFSNYREGRKLEAQRALSNYTVDLGATGTFNASSSVNLRTSAGLQYFRTHSRQVSATGVVLAPGTQTVTAGAVRDAAQSTAESATFGAFIEQTVGLNERLFLTASARTDQNSAFGSAFEAVVYPRASASWLLSDEPFFPRIPFLSSLRYRVAYGVSGVSPNPLDALQYYSAFSSIEGGVQRSAFQFAALGNTDLKPERTVEFETGADIDLFNHRVTLEITHYRKLSRDALVSVPLAPSLGFARSSRFENLGSVLNRGWELAAHLRVLEMPQLAWELSFSGSRNRNELVELGEGVAPTINSFGRTRAIPGYPLWGLWDRPILGYNDANSNGIIEPDEVETGPEAVLLGSSTPTREASLSSTFTVLNGLFRVGTLLDYRGGYRQYNHGEANRCVASDNCRAVNDPSASLWEQARAVAARTPELGSTYAGYMEDGSYIKLRELSLSIEVPERFVNAIGSSGATITLAGRNLHTWTDYTGIDPEATVAAFGDRNVFDYHVVPMTRLWTLRVTATY